MEESITPPDGGNASLNQEQGRSAIADLLNGKPKPANPPAEKRAAPEPEAQEADDYEATSSTPDDDTDEAPEAPETFEKPRVRLSDGTEVDLDEVEEWRKGTLRQSDYTRKTQELAAQRKEYETRQAEITQKTQEFSQSIEFSIAVAEHYFPKAPDPSLLDTDPIGYLQSKENYEARANELRQLYAARENHRQHQASEQMRSFEEMKTREGQALLEALPHLKDPKRLEGFQKDILENLPHYGYTADDLKSVYDHRLIRMFNDAIAFRKLNAQKAKVEAKSKDAQPVAPVQATGKRTSAAESGGRAIQDLQKELRKTGSRHTATELIKRLL